jgi:hypothetical protein
LNDKLEMVYSLVDENEAIAMEARRVSLCWLLCLFLLVSNYFYYCCWNRLLWNWNLIHRSRTLVSFLLSKRKRKSRFWNILLRNLNLP